MFIDNRSLEKPPLEVTEIIGGGNTSVSKTRLSRISDLMTGQSIFLKSRSLHGYAPRLNLISPAPNVKHYDRIRVSGTLADSSEGLSTWLLDNIRAFKYTFSATAPSPALNASEWTDVPTTLGTPTATFDFTVEFPNVFGEKVLRFWWMDDSDSGDEATIPFRLGNRQDVVAFFAAAGNDTPINNIQLPATVRTLVREGVPNSTLSTETHLSPIAHPTTSFNLDSNGAYTYSEYVYPRFKIGLHKWRLDFEGSGGSIISRPIQFTYKYPSYYVASAYATVGGLNGIYRNVTFTYTIGNVSLHDILQASIDYVGWAQVFGELGVDHASSGGISFLSATPISAGNPLHNVTFSKTVTVASGATNANMHADFLIDGEISLSVDVAYTTPALNPDFQRLDTSDASSIVVGKGVTSLIYAVQAAGGSGGNGGTGYQNTGSGGGGGQSGELIYGKITGIEPSYTVAYHVYVGGQAAPMPAFHWENGWGTEALTQSAPTRLVLYYVETGGVFADINASGGICGGGAVIQDSDKGSNYQYWADINIGGYGTLAKTTRIFPRGGGHAPASYSAGWGWSDIIFTGINFNTLGYAGPSTTFQVDSGGTFGLYRGYGGSGGITPFWTTPAQGGTSGGGASGQRGQGGGGGSSGGHGGGYGGSGFVYVGCGNTYGSTFAHCAGALGTGSYPAIPGGQERYQNTGNFGGAGAAINDPTPPSGE